MRSGSSSGALIEQRRNGRLMTGAELDAFSALVRSATEILQTQSGDAAQGSSEGIGSGSSERDTCAKDGHPMGTS